jgi:hypothetical protein
MKEGMGSRAKSQAGSYHFVALIIQIQYQGRKEIKDEDTGEG